jgi:hypothetical protein
MSRWWFLLASIVLYAASMVLPVAHDEGPPTRLGFTYLVLGGYFFAGALMAPANPLFLVGWVGLATRRRRLALISGTCALALGIVGVAPLARMVLAFPAYWLWISSFIVLILGAFYAPPAKPAANSSA